MSPRASCSSRRILVAVAVAAAAVSSSCVPDTDLTDEGPPGAPADRAGVALLQPAPGAVGVPRNLAAVVVRFDAMPEAAARLRLVSGAGSLEGRPDGEVACGAGALCLRWQLTGTLAIDSTYRVEVTLDGSSAQAGAFATGASLDLSPPRLFDLAASASGPCVRVRFSVDEPIVADLLVRSDLTEVRVPAGGGKGPFDLGVRIDGVPADAAAEVVVTAVDVAGNSVASMPLPIRTPRATPPIAITEVLANPAGTEPTQEFVELRNLGSGPLSLAGLRLADATGSDALPAVDLAPGAFALVVASGFDEAAAKDVAPRPGTILLRVDSRIGSDGLGNSGEASTLLGADGLEISRYGGGVETSAASWNGRSVQRTPPDACDVPSSWNREPLTPTPGW